MSPVNLLPPECIRTRRAEARMRGWTLTVAGLALLCAASWGWRAVYGTRVREPAGLDAARQQIADLDRQRTVLAKQTAALSQTVRTSSMVTEHPNWADLLRLLAARRGDTMVLERVEVQSRGDTDGASDRKKSARVSSLRTAYVVTLAGYAGGRREVSEFVRSLELLGLFENVRLTETRTTRLGGGSAEVVSFTLSCSLREPSTGTPAPPERTATVQATPEETP